MNLRQYQQTSLDKLYQWWMTHPSLEEHCILVKPTGSGKSVVIAELVRLLWDTWPEERPRTLVVVPSKELAEQNADKLAQFLPAHLHLDYYSASVGRKRPDADVIVATIGSVYKHAHIIGNIKAVVIDECFAGDTKIALIDGHKRIDQVLPGDLVFTATGIGTVKAVSSRIPKSIYRVELSNGSVIRATGNHPFFSASGWKTAKNLARGDGIVRLQDMPALWEGLSSLDERFWHGERMQNSASSIIQKGEILFNILLEESGKSDVYGWRQRKNDTDAKVDQPPTKDNWWQWTWLDRTSNNDAFSFGRWLASGITNKNRDTEISKNISDLLQSRFGESVVENCYRARRSISQWQADNDGSKKGQLSEYTWVESVSVEESGCIDPVFNLQISGHPSFFANDVLVHNCHLVNPDGPGMYRQLLRDLAKYCQFRVVGLTATPFRGNGCWLTDGKDPLFSGIAHEVTIQELLDSKYLAPLVRPIDAVKTRIDTTGISTASGDYAIDDLSERVSSYLPSVADEAVKLAADRKHWLAFCPTVANAMTFVDLLQARGIDAALVCGETPKKERSQLIADFRAGKLRCLVTVLALATGFDVPSIDCIIWIRPTISPVLYVQGAGRGLRIAGGKTDCLWIDATDTTERMGPIDKIRGRKRIKKTEDTEAPYKICDQCGAHVRPASALECPDCGFVFPPKEEKEFKGASNAAILSRQMASKIVRYEVTNVTYHRHVKPGSPDSLRVEYWSGLRVVAKEWVCFEHTGFARAKAEAWWATRFSNNKNMNGTFFVLCYEDKEGLDNQMQDWHAKLNRDVFVPRTVNSAISCLVQISEVEQVNESFNGLKPAAIHVNESGKFPEIIKFEWENHNDQSRTSGQNRLLSEGIDAPAISAGKLQQLHLQGYANQRLQQIRPYPG